MIGWPYIAVMFNLIWLTIGLLYDIFNFLGVFYVLISIANIVVKNISKTPTEKIVEN